MAARPLRVPTLIPSRVILLPCYPSPLPPFFSSFIFFASPPFLSLLSFVFLLPVQFFYSYLTIVFCGEDTAPAAARVWRAPMIGRVGCTRACVVRMHAHMTYSAYRVFIAVLPA